jgi:hypothetical protein
MVCDRKPVASHLLRTLRDPLFPLSLTVPEWQAFLAQARLTRLAGRVAADLEADVSMERLPAAVRPHLIAAARVGRHDARRLRWEVNRVERALRDLDVPIILLKGAAYLMAELPPARGRLAGDLDIMVPEERLEDVHKALLAEGWEEMKPQPYDQEYYRRWMHELAPLRNVQRGFVTDVHHNILPRTSRLGPDPAELWRGAQLLPGSHLRVLAPEVMVLHSAAHLFYDGDMRLAIRDLADIADLLRFFGEEEGFWLRLVERAARLDLVRPLFYALRYSERLLGVTPPEGLRAVIGEGAPSAPVMAIMDRLVPCALLPPGAWGGGEQGRLALLLLFIRSHWLRMPPLLLTRHLAHQVYVRVFVGSEEI